MKRVKAAQRIEAAPKAKASEIWAGMDLRIEVHWPCRVPPRCEAQNDVLVDLTEPPTPKERAAGRATRVAYLTSKQVRQLGVCLDCNLALRLHPFGRRRTSQNLYCTIARDRAKRAVRL